ncbi:MAG: T9SS type A sorting domain-containing protein, partial [Vicingaceae bacterium]
GNSSTQQYPTHIYTSNGTYTVQLTVTNANGNDNIIKTDFIVVNMPISPSTADVTICANSSANLTASTGSGTLDWFDAATAGNLVYSGTNFTTPTLSANTTYYVETVITTPVVNMAKPDNTGGGNNFTANQHLIFDVYNTMEIVSVEVVAQGAGNRTIELRDNTGAVLQSTTVNIPNGIARINLNFMINPGTDYELGLSGASTVDLYRNNTGVSYPYTLPGYGAVTSSSAGLNFYYFFYDWEVKEPNCTSARVPAIATVNNVDVSTSLAGNTITANASPASYQWVDCNNNFSLIGGETNQGYVATVNGDYAAIITENGCVDTTACTNILITGIDGASSNSGISIYPNPATDVLNIDLTTTANIERLTLFDVKGKLIYETVDFTNSNIQINMNKLSEGIYMLKVQSTNEVKNYKVLKQ